MKTLRTYAWTFAALLAFTGLAFGLSFLSLGVWGTVLAMLIAVIKSVLIALFFMHLMEHRVSSRATIGVAAVLAAFLIGFALLDVGTRSEEGGRDSSAEEGAAVSWSAPVSPVVRGTRWKPKVEGIQRAEGP